MTLYWAFFYLCWHPQVLWNTRSQSVLLKHCSTVVHNQSLLWWGSLNGWSREPHLLEFKSSTLIVGASDNHEDFHFRCCPASTLSAALACGSTLPGNLDNNSINIISLHNHNILIIMRTAPTISIIYISFIIHQIPIIPLPSSSLTLSCPDCGFPCILPPQGVCPIISILILIHSILSILLVGSLPMVERGRVGDQTYVLKDWFHNV